MATDNAKRSTEHPIDRPPDTDPQQGHEHPEADPPAPHSRQGHRGSHEEDAAGLVAPRSLKQGGTSTSDAPSGGGSLQLEEGGRRAHGR